MEIDQLRNFLKVAELGNFTRAAEEMLLSQPALSRSVARLEEELGQPVFERQSRKVVLTDSGKLLQSRARQILALIDDTKIELTDDGQCGRIRVAAIPTIAPYFLPGLLRQFGEAYPDAEVLVQEDTTEHLLKRMTQGEIDLAILALPISAKYLEVVELFEEELFLVVANDHPLAEKKQVRLADIESLPFVLLDEAHCLSDNIVSFCRQKSFQPVAVERTSQLATVQELVSLDHGISMVPAMAKVLDESKRRIYRSITGPKATRKVVMVFNPYRFQSKMMTSFQKHVIQYSAQFLDAE